MKLKIQLIGVCITILAIGAPISVHARTKKAESPSPAPSTSPAAASSPAKSAAKTSPAPSASPATERAIPFHGMIGSVDARAKTFTIAGKEKSRVFKITDKTVITKAGAAATMKDITANEEARGSYWKSADGSLEAKSVKLGPLTEQEKAAKEARKTRSAEKKAAASPSASPKP